MPRTSETSPGKSRRTGPRSRSLRPAKDLSVSIIGAGRLGTAFGLALRATGYKIRAVAAKRPGSARRAAKEFGAATLALSAAQLRRLTADQLERINRSPLILIATPDDVIAKVAKQLAEILQSGPGRSRNPGNTRRVALHTSGALAADVLGPLRKAGFAVGSLHPLVSISESRSGSKSLTHAFFSVEGDPAAVRAGKSLVKSLGGESFTIDSRCKALYHAAALTASPNMTALFDIAVEMLGVCGLSRRRARRILLPLVQSTVANLATQDPAKALTGTFKRGDTSTVLMHLGALKAANLPQALNAYVVLGQKSIEIAGTLGTNARQLDEIAQILSRAAKKSRRR
jgi:predicted short-subunit dehydrogenase-like oxidoreductase (DUF2520 family)